ncbi:MAG: alpha/beta hydrolase [Bacteroidota bacterium]
MILLAGWLVLFVSCRPGTDPEVPGPDDDLTEQIPKPALGYGSDGPFTVAKSEVASPLFPGRSIEIFYPEGMEGPRPTLFFCHALGGDQSSFYQGLLDFVAMKGYAIVFAPYPTSGVTIEDRYRILWDSFQRAVDRFPDIITTQKVGFVGHSFGAGASIGLAHRAFVEEGWGASGRIIFAMAQWYSYELTPTQLSNFPTNTKMIIQVYDEDDVNDHRVAIDVFKNINIETSEKDFVYVNSSVVADYEYVADHGVPNTILALDALDYYAIHRLLDALIDYSFNDVLTAKAVALGGGDPAQVTMPCVRQECMAELVVTDDPSPNYQQSRYMFSCSDFRNPRSEFCES